MKHPIWKLIGKEKAEKMGFSLKKAKKERFYMEQKAPMSTYQLIAKLEPWLLEQFTKPRQ